MTENKEKPPIVFVDLAGVDGKAQRVFTVRGEVLTISEPETKKGSSKAGAGASGNDTLADGGPVFRRLFGDPPEPTFRSVVRASGVTRRADPSPASDPLWIRIRTTDEELRRTRWNAAEWRGHRLEDCGWTFAFDGGTPLETINLRIPLSVLALQGLKGNEETSDDVAVGDLREGLLRASPFSNPQFVVAAKAEEFRKLVESALPKIVAGVLEMKNGGSGSTLRLRDDVLPAKAFIECLNRRPPKLLVLGVHTKDESPCWELVEPLLPRIPLVLLMASDDRSRLETALARFWRELLSGTPGSDPLRLFARASGGACLAWSRHQSFRLDVEQRPPTEILARWLLGRSKQKRTVASEFRELQRKDRHRVLAVLGRGDQDNLIEYFPSTLIDHVASDSQNRIRRSALRVRFPRVPGRKSWKEKFLDAMRACLGGEENEDLRKLLDHQGASEDDAQRTLIFEWDNQGGRFGVAPKKESLLAWAEAHEDLARACPESTRILSLLMLELSDVESNRLDKPLKDHEENRPASALRFTLLERLAPVVRNELSEFLSTKDYSTCPEEIRESVSMRILERTDGRFNATAQWIEAGERSGWNKVLKDLKATSPPQGVSKTSALLGKMKSVFRKPS